MVSIVSGNDDEIASFMYGTPSMSTVNYITENIQRNMTQLTDRAKSFYAITSDYVQTIDMEKISRAAMSIRDRMGSMWQGNHVFRLEQVGQIQQAQPVMRRWVMANPLIREKCEDHMLDGYGDHYYDVNGWDVRGDEHYDYRIATNGIFRQSDEVDADGNPMMSCTRYYENILNQDADTLTFSERVAIMQTWDIAEDHVNYGDSDPTSRYNAGIN